jgi:hypothetical protein
MLLELPIMLLELPIMLLELPIMLLELSIILLESIYSTGITPDDHNNMFMVHATTPHSANLWQKLAATLFLLQNMQCLDSYCTKT